MANKFYECPACGKSHEAGQMQLDTIRLGRAGEVRYWVHTACCEHHHRTSALGICTFRPRRRHPLPLRS